MPTPVSEMARRTHSPHVISATGGSVSGSTVTQSSQMCNSPPSGIASRAFSARFITTCWIRVGSAFTTHLSMPGPKVSLMFSGSVRCRMSAVSVMKEARSMGRVSMIERRLKSSIRCTSCAALRDSSRMVSATGAISGDRPGLRRRIWA